MLTVVYKSVLIVAVVCVLLVFLAPTIDLPESALRANQNANKVMICMTLLAVELFFAVGMLLFRVGRENPISRFSPQMNPLFCTFLC
ncbi:MAG: hypothetical protein LAO76_10180 [Acidobacteriia bacterium]|jgi:hypothetical protein|nr:hypothetical protein [Terriglobia bacterium]